MIKFRYCILAFAIILIINFPAAGLAKDPVISHGDHLKITVYENEDLTSETPVSAEGIITFPLIGDVKVAGLNVHQAEKEIAKRLSKGYLRDPLVTVVITETVYVTGEVQKPGAYKAELGTTVIKAIILAGGLTEKAAPGRIKLTRKVDGKESTNKVQMSDPIQPEDVITVPESFF